MTATGDAVIFLVANAATLFINTVNVPECSVRLHAVQLLALCCSSTKQMTFLIFALFVDFAVMTDFLPAA